VIETTPKVGETMPKPAPQPLSKASRARLLKVLSAAAENGDVGAATALLELARKAEQDAMLAEALVALRASKGNS